ncbi:MAG: (d)CMP kinase [Rectinemataceae bacterium]
MKVAIDGPAGCGKSTIARMIAENLGFLYINSGNLYRAAAWLCIQHGVDWHDADAVVQEVNRHHFEYHEDGSVSIDGIRLSTELRTPEVDAIVSQVSAIPAVREEVNAIIRAIAEGRDVVSEGRDITTIVFPDAEVKFYLDASTEVRAMRRYREHAHSAEQSEEAVRNLERIRRNIEMRDVLDSSKAIGALKIAPDAQYLDTSDLTIGQVYEKVYNTILRIRKAHGRE